MNTLFLKNIQSDIEITIYKKKINKNIYEENYYRVSGKKRKIVFFLQDILWIIAGSSFPVKKTIVFTVKWNNLLLYLTKPKLSYLIRIMRIQNNEGSSFSVKKIIVFAAIAYKVPQQTRASWVSWSTEENFPIFGGFAV